MAQVGAAASEMIPQLEAARQLVLADAQIYTQIVPGILPIIGPTAALEIRRWGAEFLAESFASPALGKAQKEDLAVQVLPTLRGLLEIPGEDAAVVKSVVQTVASLYELVFKRIIYRSEESFTWQTMTAVKSDILKRMDTAPIGVRVCCIKFVQKVVQVQTPGVISDPRRPEQNETSIALVPRNHPLLPLPNLEAEASGLLDRLLNVFHENISDPILIDATLNCMSILIRTRAAVAHKIISAVLNFNPLKPANAPMKPKLRVIVKSMERTTRAFLKNINKHNPQGQLAAKIDAYIARLTQSRATIFSEAQSLKRPAPTDTPDGCGGPKRTRLAAGPTKYPHMPPPPNSFAHFFTLTEDAGLIAFDVKVLPVDMINAITALTLQHVDQQAMDEAIGAIRARYAHLQKMQQPTPVPDIPMAGPTGVDDEDDYDPEYDPGNEAAMTPASAQVVEELIQPELALGPFQLPKPSPLTEAEIALLSQQTVDRVFSMVTSLDLIPQTMSRQKLGLNRLAASTNDRDAWFTMMTRLATRAPSGLDDLIASELDSDDENTESITVKLKSERHDSYTNIDKPSLANGIRNTLYRYVLEDFRPRLNIAISWLNEEWYSDRLRLDAHPSLTSTESNPASNLPNYYNWTYHLLDTLLPYLDARDNKILIRFLSEIPAIDAGILDRVKSLARDPERISMCMMALQYLIMFRPPVRPLVIDTVQSIAQDEEYKEAKPQASKILGKWRPAVLAENVTPAQAMMEREGKGKEKKLGKMEQGVVDALVAENHSATTLTIDPRRRDAGNSPAQASA